MKSVFIRLLIQHHQWRIPLHQLHPTLTNIQSGLGSLCGGGGRERGYGICSSEQELNHKQLFKEIRELEATRPKGVANSAVRAKFKNPWGKRKPSRIRLRSTGRSKREKRMFEYTIGSFKGSDYNIRK